VSELPERIWGQLLNQLPLSFQHKMDHFVRWQDKHAYLLGKLLLLEGLQAFGFEPGCLEDVKFNRYGKPYLNSDIDFNLSHSGNFVICGISRKSKLGIDIEKIRPIDLSNFRRIFSAKEWEQIHETGNPLENFYKCWTIKESVAKAEGKGLLINWEKVQFLNQNLISLNNQIWNIYDLKISPGYSSSLVTNTIIKEEIKKQYVEFYE
jgi:4'-phosphopantetheinyl transferase